MSHVRTPRHDIQMCVSSAYVLGMSNEDLNESCLNVDKTCGLGILWRDFLVNRQRNLITDAVIHVYELEVSSESVHMFVSRTFVVSVPWLGRALRTRRCPYPDVVGSCVHVSVRGVDIPGVLAYGHALICITVGIRHGVVCDIPRDDCNT